MSLAKVAIIGNVGQEPTIRVTQSGTSVTSFTVAVNKRRRADSTEDPPPDWYRVTAFGKLAEIADQYVRKGNRVYVDGRQQFDFWTDDSGNQRLTIEIVANDLVLLTPRSENTVAPDDSDLPF
jgi:single-strand DNA-binding protein